MASTAPLQPLKTARLDRIALGLGACAAAMGIIVLFGWATQNPLIKSIVPGAVSMKANTALGFLACGLMVLGLVRPGIGARRVNAIAGLTVLLGAATLLEYVFDWQLGIDELLFDDPDTISTSSPGRMSPVTALCFVLIGLAVLWRRMRIGLNVYPSQYLSLLVAILGYIATLGYALDTQPLYRVKVFTSMAIHTALTFTLLGAAVLLTQLPHGFTARIAHGLGARIFARLLPVSLLAVPLIIVLANAAVHSGLFEEGFGLALVAVLLSGGLTAAIYQAAGAINASEAYRERTDLAEQVQAKLQLAMSSARMGLLKWQADGKQMRLDTASCSAIGFCLPGDDDTSCDPLLFVHPTDLPALMAARANYLQQGIDLAIEARIRNAEDAFVHVRIVGIRQHPDDDTLLCSFIDISEQKNAEQRAEAASEKMRSLLDSLPDMVITFDSASNISSLHVPVLTQHPFVAPAWQGKKYGEIFPAPLCAALDSAMTEAFATDLPASEHCQLSIGEAVVYCRVTATRVVGKQRDLGYFVGVISDETEVAQARANLLHLAFHDTLTELPNRRLFMDRLAQAIHKSQRTRQYGAVLLLDLDRFKDLNDTHGHDAGDEYLKLVAQAMQRTVRAVDTIARWGGDEFVVLLEELGNEEKTAHTHACEVADKLDLALRGNFTLSTGAYVSGASVGYAIFCGAPPGGVDAVVQRADKAMYAVKKQRHAND